MSTSCPQPDDANALLARAREVLVGGVNSPVRAHRAVGGEPRPIARAEGAHIIDTDKRRYVDLVGSWGTAIVGHAHRAVVDAVQRAAADGLSFGATCPAEVELAETIVGALPGVERVRFVSSGTEAVMSVLRLARAATGRDIVLKCAGAYHGHADAMLVAAGSGAASAGTPDSAGVPTWLAERTIVIPYNDADAAREVMARRGREIAAVLVEPLAGNMGMVLPRVGFLETLRAACDEQGSLLVFDEVMTGFRVAWGGYQRLPGVPRPDLTCLGKVIGGGLAVAAYAGPATLMEQVSPCGPVYQAGTLSGNPLAMAAGIATLVLCAEEGFYAGLGLTSQRLAQGLAAVAAEAGVDVQTVSLGGMLGLFFAGERVEHFDAARAADTTRFAAFYHAMLERGVWLPPSPFEAMFVSAAHGPAEIDHVVRAAADVFTELAR